MGRKLAVEIIGDAASLKAALGSATAATEKFAAGYKTSFAGMTDATLRLSVAQDKLAISTARYGVGTTGAAAATVKFRREVDALAASQARGMASIGRSMTSGITVPAALLTFVAVKMGVEFNKNMLMVQTQAGASAAEIKKLNGEVLNLAKTSPIGPIELAKGLYHLESLGLRGAQAMDALKTSSIAAGLGVADIEGVTTALGGAIVSGITGAQNFDEAMGTLNATIGVGNMRMEDMVGALGTGLLPAAKNAGLSLDQVGAALAVMTDRGVSAENAGTRLRMTFALMQSPSNEAVRALNDMGINADLLGERLRGPNGLLTVLRMLHKGMASVGPARGARDVLKAFGGGRSGAGILTLVQSLDSDVSSYQGKLEDIQIGQKKFAENVKVYMESPAYKLSSALSEVQASLTKLGQGMAPAIAGIAKSISAITSAFDLLPTAAKKDIGIIVGILAVAGPLMLAFVGVRKMILAVRAAFVTLPIYAGPAIAATEAEMVGMQAVAGATAARVGAIGKAWMLLGRAGPISLVAIIGVQFAYPWEKHLFEKYLGADFEGTKPGAGVSTLKVGTLITQWDGKVIVQGPNGTYYSLKQWRALTHRPEEGTRGPGKGVKNKFGIAGPDPQASLPRKMREDSLLADISPGKADDLAQANKEVAFWNTQKKRAKRGTDTYEAILTGLSQATSKVRSLESEIENKNKKKTKGFKLPPGLSADISRAQRSGSEAKEIAAYERAAAFLRKKIAHEKNAVMRAQEEKKLTSITAQIAASRKKQGESTITALQASVDASAVTQGVEDDIRALTKLRTGLLKQIALQRGNNELLTKLNETDKKMAEIKQQIVENLKSAFGTLGAGPLGEAGGDAIAKWRLGVKFSAQQYLRDLQRQMAIFKIMQKGLNDLSKRGAPKALVEELRGQGQAAFPEIWALAHADKGTLAKFFSTFKEREKVFQTIATAEIKAAVVNINGPTKGGGSSGSHPPNAVTHGKGRGPSGGRGPRGGHAKGIAGRNFSVAVPTAAPVRAMATVGERSTGAMPLSRNRVLSQPTVVHIDLDGRTISTVVLDNMQAMSKHGTAQVRGRHGGVRFNLT